MRAALASTALALIIAVSCAGDPSDESVLRVVDGDTFEVETEGGPERVRLIGIDTPETGECLADAAEDLLAELLDAGPLELRSDRSDRDRYGRLLRYAYSDGRFVNEALVREGLAIARSYPPDTAEDDRLARAAVAAREERLGMWAPDACGSALEVDVTITEMRADPPGGDLTDLNEEWVEIRNAGDETLQLDGWVLKDESASHRFHFPESFAVRPGQTVRIHSGCGLDDDSSLFWCNRGSAIWNNDGDTAFLLDPNGNIVAFLQWAPQ